MNPKITHITEKDIEILAQKLGKNQKEKIALIHLLKQEPEKIDQILDFESIKRYILEAPSPIPISAQLYFQYLGRLALGKRGLKNQELISYITKLLMRFLKMDSLAPFYRLGSRRNFVRMSDLLLSLEKTAGSMQAYRLHHFIADYSLFVCGLFKENIERCWNGSPGMEFYESLGMRSYALAASYPEAQKNSLQGIFSFLSAAFKEVRFALNEIQEQFFHFSDISPSPYDS
ncbi:hypothetical protein A946_06465 [Methylacidiphilum kamchatkense Kam1]|uniref:Uncharacterized protein n=1 Tax=Methylacidiphilum kamchatkense Kam1 TaxID=1202785 RepID=A0A0C1RKD8_9BACT|nr:hypothetical protein [Methylacidiphilum kamchatkense]KIE58527.1 hypothetical protein A946_06465 [Methylacidiphilum kamchatkense Kam1]QDQ43345.1 hypothetical protein kam1_2137 [Methylacidiphilum kamchatkense Kam1]